jgi:hypothetical protein
MAYTTEQINTGLATAAAKLDTAEQSISADYKAIADQYRAIDPNASNAAELAASYEASRVEKAATGKIKIAFAKAELDKWSTEYETLGEYNDTANAYIEEYNNSMTAIEESAANLEDAAMLANATITDASSATPQPNPPGTTPGPTPNVPEEKSARAAASARSPSEKPDRTGLSTFISAVRDRGIAVSSKYLVTLPTFTDINMSDVQLMCNVVGMPDLTLTTSNQRIIGENLTLPDGATYGTLSIQCVNTQEFSASNYFEAWSNMVFDRDGRTIGWYSDYAKVVKVAVLDKTGNPRYEITYRDCWPLTINSGNLDYQSTSPMSVNVVLQYKYWTTRFIEPFVDRSANKTDLFDPSIVSQLPNINGVLTQLDKSNSVDIYNRVGPMAASIEGNKIGSGILGASNDYANAVRKLDNAADGTAVGSLLGKYADQLGTSGSQIGAGISSLGTTLNNIIAPAGAIANGVVGAANALGAMDNLLGRLGIKTNLGNTVTNLNGVAGQFAILNQLNGIPGAMDSLGSVVGSISGDLAAINRSLVNVPGATKELRTTGTALSNNFSDSGNKISTLSNMNWVN